MKNYDVNPDKDAPLISLKISSKILKDLVLRSEENGNPIEREIGLRLMRSLERDLKMTLGTTFDWIDVGRCGVVIWSCGVSAF